MIVEEYNPPCQDMSRIVASRYTARSGEAVSKAAFSKAATLMRGVVGVVEVPGAIAAGDDVVVNIYETPEWLTRSPD